MEETYIGRVNYKILDCVVRKINGTGQFSLEEIAIKWRLLYSILELIHKVLQY